MQRSLRLDAGVSLFPRVVIETCYEMMDEVTRGAEKQNGIFYRLGRLQSE